METRIQYTEEQRQQQQQPIIPNEARQQTAMQFSTF